MFGIDFPELVVIGVVALVVLGPERLPKAARFVGLWVRRARGQWNSVKSELERELAADEFRRTLHDTEKAMRDIDADVRAADADARREFDAMRKAASDSSPVVPVAPAAPAAPPASDAPAPFDTLADFDPYAADTAPPSVADVPVTLAKPGDAVAAPAVVQAAAPAASSAYAAAAAALGRHEADARLAADTPMTGPNPAAASLAHGPHAVAATDHAASDVTADARTASPTHAPVDLLPARDDDDARPA